MIAKEDIYDLADHSLIERMSESGVARSFESILKLEQLGQAGSAVKLSRLIVASDFVNEDANSQAWLQLLLRLNQPKLVEDYLSRYSRSLLDSDTSVYLLALAEKYLGRLDRSAERFDRLLKSPQFLAASSYNLTQLNRPLADPITNTLSSLTTPSSSLSDRVYASFALYMDSELKENYETGFEWLTLANNEALKPFSRVPFARAIEFDVVAKLIDKANLRCQSSARISDAPIFVVGLPRSGTTLTSRIFAQSSDYQEIGELPILASSLRSLLERISRNPETIDTELLEQCADTYLNEVRCIANTTKVIDKTPSNLIYAGLIPLVFPNARIVFLDREPASQRFSLYRQMFNVQSAAMAYAGDLRLISTAIENYQRFSASIVGRYPKNSVVLSYNRLVEEPLQTLSQLAEVVGMTFDEDSLAFKENASPISTASAVQMRSGLTARYLKRHERYAKQVNEVLARE